MDFIPAIIHRHVLLAALFILFVPWTAHAGYLGAELVDQRGTDTEPSGALVTRVTPGGPAAKADIQPKDLIVALIRQTPYIGGVG
jgi:S1-C subfamily serine protease